MLNQFAFLCSLVVLAFSGIGKRDVSGQIERVALGESVRLGTLYDARKSLMYNGMELFDEINVNEVSTGDGKTEENIEYDSDSNSQGKNFGVKAELELGIMSGMVKVKGSAEYFTDDLKKNNTIRFTNSRLTESSYRDFNLNAAREPNAGYCDMMDEEYGPTHFVSRINYGQRVYMTFDKEYASGDDITRIKGELYIDVKNIPKLNITGNAKVELDGQDYKIDDSIAVKLFGDAMLETIPTTYEEAITAYKETSVRQGLQYTSPIKYYLTPMDVVCKDKTAVAINAIKAENTNNAIKALKDLKNHMQKVNYLLETDPAIRFSAIRLPLVTFSLKLEAYYSELAAKFVTIIPRIKAGGGESDLESELNSFSSGTFGTARTKQFLNQRKREIIAIETIHKKIEAKGIILSDPVSANDNECIFKHQNVTSFTINILPDSDVATTFLESTGDWKEDTKWVNDDEIVLTLADAASEFSEYAETNMARLGDKKDLNCYMLKLEVFKKGPEIEKHLYQDGKLLTDNFQTPDQYDRPTCGKSFADGFELTAEANTNSDVSGIKVKVEWTGEGDEKLSSEQVISRATTLRVSGLQPSTSYNVAISSVVRQGHGEGYPSERAICTTKIASPPLFLRVEDNMQNDDISLNASWSMPRIISEEVADNSNKYYKISYGVHNAVHTKLQVSPDNKNVYMPQLLPLTRYTINVALEMDTETGETASLDFTTPPDPPSWTKTEETSSSASFTVALDSLNLSDDQSMDYIILTYSKMVNGVASDTQEHWHQPTSDISVDDLEQETEYEFSFRLTVRVSDAILYSRYSSKLHVQTTKRVDHDAADTRAALDVLETKNGVITQIISEIDQINSHLSRMSQNEVPSEINDLDNSVTKQFANVEKNVVALERSNCNLDGLEYWGKDWNVDDDYVIGVTTVNSLPECVKLCGNTDKCQSVSLVQDPGQSNGECNLNEKRLLYKDNKMYKKRNTRAVELNCYASSLTTLSSYERCVMEGKSFKDANSGNLMSRSGTKFYSLQECVSYCQKLPNCEGVTFDLLPDFPCYAFSTMLVKGQGESVPTSTSVNLACLG